MEWRYPWVIIFFGFLLFFWIGKFLRRGRSHFIFKSSTPQLEANLLGRFDHQKRLWKKPNHWERFINNQNIEIYDQ